MNTIRWGWKEKNMSKQYSLICHFLIFEGELFKILMKFLMGMIIIQYS